MLVFFDCLFVKGLTALYLFNKKYEIGLFQITYHTIDLIYPSLLIAKFLKFIHYTFNQKLIKND